MPKAGDILELDTKAGLAYVQYTHQHPLMGGVIRVLPGIFLARPDDFHELSLRRERFVACFPVRTAVSKGILHIVAHETIPAYAREFPIFRTGPLDGNGQVSDWWLWDGTRSWHVGKLSAAQRKFPLKSIWNDTLLATRIADGWTPDDVPE